MKLGFIGTGNMAGAIMGGIIKKGIIAPEEIIGSDIMEAGRERAKKEHGIHRYLPDGYLFFHTGWLRRDRSRRSAIRDQADHHRMQGLLQCSRSGSFRIRDLRRGSR